jgi:tight adherence protein B
VALNPYLIALYVVGGFGIFLAAKTGWEIAVRNAEEYRQKFVEEHGQELEDMYSGFGPEQLLMLTLLVGFGAPVILVLFFKAYVLAAFLFLAGFFLPKYLVKWMKKRREDEFTAQLVDAMDLISNALKAGYSLPQALQTIVDEMKPPISQEFQVVTRELKMGKSIDDALNALSERIPSEELDLIVVSITLARQTGGNLSEIMENIANTVRQRNALFGKIKALTAQGKMQGIVVGCLPIGLGFILNVMDPKMMYPMFHTFLGFVFIAAVIIMELMGAFLIKKIITIDV